MSFVITITGTPGVGKSSVCANLANRMPVAAHVKADQLHRFLVSGGQWPSAGTPEAKTQLILRTRNAAVVAANFAAAGIPAILDEVISTDEQLAVLGELLPNATIVVLCADPAVVLQRDSGRGKQTAANYGHVAADIEKLLGERAIFVNSSDMSLDETVDQVRRVAMMSPCS